MSHTTLSLADQKVLWRAVNALERESLVARLSDLSGEPVSRILRRMPKSVSKQINAVVQRALMQALEVALYKIDTRFPEPGAGLFKVFSGITGGVSGFFGIATLAVELPVSTTLMLRSIAGIAQRQGENLKNPSARLACLEVFALGPRAGGAITETAYFATRTFLAKAVSEAAQIAAERGLAQRSSPAIIELIAAIASRFGLVVSDKVAAAAVPVVGAIGGAAVNLAFMEHFQRLAGGHFAVRRLERQYGTAEVRRVYDAWAHQLRQRTSRPKAI